MAPPVAVVMPVHNALPYLDEAVASILGQSFGDFEFVILDDCSTDGSAEALESYATRDSRIRLVRATERLGPAASSARVVAEARAPLVARMDADDISHPDRLRRQLAVFAAEPDAGVVASLHQTIAADGRTVRAGDLGRLVRRSPFAPFVHGSAMFRRSVLEAAGGYRAGCDYWEDIDLFLRIAGKARILVIPQSLYRHRIAETSTRRTGRSEAVARAYGSMYRRFDGLRSGTEGVPADAGSARIPPQAFTLLGSPLIWAGERPGLLGLLLRQGRLGLDGASFAALAWTALAEISPRGLRFALRRALALRNRAAERALRGKPVVEWVPDLG